MLLSELREYLKTKIECPQWYIGKIDGTKEQCIGIYSIAGPKPSIALGGLANTSYSTKAISILVHWGKNANIAEQKAQEVYNSLFGQEAVIGNKRVIKFDMRTSEPVSIGTDSNGIYEYVIETVIYYER
ncbi:phage tail terminator protein [Clostridium algidicarnis]|uniref:phage tail terminator protein n=1 Tax=Clostridium algidicarnis TaxID=37659 RepID=UPI001C0D684F|nr:minor capsid protein [Clostridium algidicarnis]MBU3226804.1 minor capsid protein [Clostridium algidicarnis]MBU3250285.1 minor capsid protein [Clostridium algidicarnis]